MMFGAKPCGRAPAGEPLRPPNPAQAGHPLPGAWAVDSCADACAAAHAGGVKEKSRGQVEG